MSEELPFDWEGAGYDAFPALDLKQAAQRSTSAIYGNCSERPFHRRGAARSGWFVAWSMKSLGALKIRCYTV